MCFLFQLQIKLNEKNDIAAIKNYLATDLIGSGPEYSRRHRRHARRAFKQMNALLRNGLYGDRPNIPNVCFLLINEKKTSRYLRYLRRSGINMFCHHMFVFSGDDWIDLTTIRKEICPEAQIVRGIYD